MIYLDNAASTHPKPETVYAAVDRAVRTGGNPGRSGHRAAFDAAREVFEARAVVGEVLGASDPARVIFTLNATHSLNLALKGVLRRGDHVVTTVMEHNSVLRPLHRLEASGVETTLVAADREGHVDPAALEGAIRPNTRLVALCHASNVSGTLQDAEAVGAFCRRRGLLFLLDASQTAGAVPLDAEGLGVHLLAAPGHKGLLGPQGTGVLVLAAGVDLATVLEGGTGTHSEQRTMPDELPEGLEAGTLNTPGIAGLAAGARYLLDRGVADVRRAEEEILAYVLPELASIPGLLLYGPREPAARVAVVSFNLEGRDGAHVGFALDEAYGIAVRVGLHCAPDAHKALGSFPAGTVRASFGPFNTLQDAEALVRALRELARL
ncbi:MAG: aminotransferase class V-fold PLP-dependent enzyme [Deltaproteobacteria bacterium]|nr:aminotransferase class V-fold PLP-dependent enzyme [Deltaproteobacteria bacterium]